MGGCVSANELNYVRNLERKIPSWCLRDAVVTAKDATALRASWKVAMSGDAEPYKIARKDNSYLTPLVFFYDTFYEYLFDLAPEVKPYFKRKMSAQGKMLANVIKYVLENVENDQNDSFAHSLAHLARVHNARGINANHYSVMGMVLVHTMRKCLGEKFTPETLTAWIKVYSKMMDHIIPVVLSGQTPLDHEHDTDVFNYKENVDISKSSTVERKGSTPVVTAAEVITSDPTPATSLSPSGTSIFVLPCQPSNG